MKNLIQPIASITSTSGLAGNVKLKPLSRFFDDYIIDGKLYIGESIDKLKDCHLEEIKGIGKSRSFKLKDHNSVYDAKSLIGKMIFIKADIGDKITYVGKHVVGYQVRNSSGESIGELKDVMWLPNNDIYVIQNSEKEILVPVISEFVKEVRHEKSLIIIEPIEGLLD
jgi:16S rRNA processing protein RimM